MCGALCDLRMAAPGNRRPQLQTATHSSAPPPPTLRGWRRNDKQSDVHNTRHKAKSAIHQGLQVTSAAFLCLVLFRFAAPSPLRKHSQRVGR